MGNGGGHEINAKSRVHAHVQRSGTGLCSSVASSSTIAFAGIMARLMFDVNMAEEAELWRLEHSSPRSPALSEMPRWEGMMAALRVAAQMEVETAGSSLFMPMGAFEEPAKRAVEVPQLHVPEPSPTLEGDKEKWLLHAHAKEKK